MDATYKPVILGRQCYFRIYFHWYGFQDLNDPLFELQLWLKISK